MNHFDPDILSQDDLALAAGFMQTYGNKTSRSALLRLREPDLIIAPDGVAYLYRWHLVPRNAVANVYFHIQVGDDPARPLHDHYYDNQSVILAGGYDEILQGDLTDARGRRLRHVEFTVHRPPGTTIHRQAEQPHRLTLPPGVPYSMSLFTTGPRRRTWGFHYPDGWRPFDDVSEIIDGVAVHKELVT